MGDECLENYVTVEEAAELFGVSNVRVLALLHQPCRKCRIVKHEINENTGKINSRYFRNEDGCEECNYTGRRLPGYKVGNGEKSPWLIKKEDILNFKSQPVGFPRGQLRPKDVDKQ